MPTIPTYQSNIALHAAPNVAQKGMSVSIPEGAFGTGLAAGAMKAAAIYEKARDEADDLRATENATQYLGKLTEAAQKAANENTLGKAIGLSDRWSANVAETMKPYRESLSPEQFEKFQQKIAPHVLQANKTIRAHEFHQIDEHRKLTDTAYQQTLAGVATPETLESVTQQVIGYWNKTKEGQSVIDAVAREQQHKSLRDYVATTVIRRAILDGNLDAAAALLAERPDLKDRGAFEGQIKGLRGQREHEAQTAEQNTAGSLYMEHDKEGSTAQSRAKIMASPGFRALSPRMQSIVEEHLQARVDRALSRREHQSDRARQESDRAERVRFDSPESTGTFLSLMDRIARNGAVPDTELWAHAPSIGTAQVRTLVAANRQAKSAAGRFQIDRDLVEAAAPKNKEQAKTYRAITEAATVEWKERNPGKVPTRQEQEEILRAGYTGMAYKKWYGGTGSAAAYEFKPMSPEFVVQATREADRRGLPRPTQEQLLRGWAMQKDAR